MSEERIQILKMLSEGQITPEEAERLLGAIEVDPGADAGSQANGAAAGPPTYLRVIVDAEDPKEGPVRVNVRVPVKLIRAGVKLSSLIPQQARDHMNEALREEGIDFDVSQITAENLDELVEQLRELTVDVDSNSAKVRVFCE